jgi:hypothetical protein
MCRVSHWTRVRGGSQHCNERSRTGMTLKNRRRYHQTIGSACIPCAPGAQVTSGAAPSLFSLILEE